MLMRVLGALLFVASSGGTVYATWAMFHRERPVDVGFAVAAPLLVLLALLGLLLVFVPGFF